MNESKADKNSWIYRESGFFLASLVIMIIANVLTGNQINDGFKVATIGLLIYLSLSNLYKVSTR